MTHVAGVDFGSDSMRVGVWDVRSGERVLSVSRPYRRWADGAYSDPARQQFRQHPLDHLEALESAFDEVAERIGPGEIEALAVDSTGSTPAPVNIVGQPLSLLDEHRDDPDSMFWLWKDHTASDAAARVNAVLETSTPDFTSFQGTYSSEWWWAKILHAVEHSPWLRAQAESWVEHSDWLPNLLVGRRDPATFARNACAAGHKALFNSRLGGGIPDKILGQLDPYLVRVAGTLAAPPVPAGTRLGRLTSEWATRLRLSMDTVVGMGSLDAHAGAVGAGIAPGVLVKVVGTSTVDMFLADAESVDGRDIRGRCGLAEDSIVPGYLGGEAGQAAFGDLFAWYSRLITGPWEGALRAALASRLDEPVVTQILDEARSGLLTQLEREAAGRTTDIVALDWINGRRYPFEDDRAAGALINLRIGNTAPDLYRALVESAVLGSRSILESIPREVARIERIVLVGGVARKSPMVCQLLADALGYDIMLSSEDEVCARGAAIYAAVAAGHFASIPAAQERFCESYRVDYAPKPDGVKALDQAYLAYQRVAEWMNSQESERVVY